MGLPWSALAPSQRLIIDRILQSPQHFAATVANQANVKPIRDGDPQLYSLRATPKLRLVYEKSGKGFRVLDLIDRATMERFSAEKAKKKMPGRGLKGQSGAPKVASRKIGELIEK